MKKSSQIFSVLLLGILVALAYFSYPVLKKRYFTPNPIVPIETIIPRPDQPPATGTISDDQAPESTADSKETDPFIPNEQTTVFENIEKEDCLNDCSTFETTSAKEYCLQVCDSTSPTEINDACTEKSGLQKDYCYKNLGIKNKNLDECKKITDKNIRESCVNTVTDKLLERSDSVEQRNP